MAYSLSPLLKPRFFVNGTNKPLVGGKLYTYLAGTTTPAATYSDDAGTPNSNPIILNTNGECDLFLDDGVAYRIIVKDANDVPYSDNDNVLSLDNPKYEAAESATLAESAKTAAETARDAANATGKVYANTTDGIAATTNGQYFNVAQTNDVFLKLYKNESGVAVFVNSYPSSTSLQDLEKLRGFDFEQPNLFDRRKFFFEDLPTLISGTVEKTTIDSISCLEVNTNNSTGTQRIYWRFDANLFPSNLISAQINIVSSGVGSSGSIAIIQRNAALSSLQTDNLITGLTNAVASETVYRVNSVIKHASAAWIDLDIQINKTTGDKLRQTVLKFPMIANGNSSLLRVNRNISDDAYFDYFPNPKLNSVGSTSFGGSTIFENGEPVLQMTTTSLVQSYWDVSATGAFKNGAVLTFACDVYSTTAGSSDTSTTACDIAIIFLDSALATISTNYQAVRVNNIYSRITKSATVPSGCAFVRFRLVKRAAVTEGKFRNPNVTTSADSTLKISVNDVTKTTQGALGMAYVSEATGSDTVGDGTSGNPVSTINKALALLGGSGTVALIDAEYTQAQRITASLVKGHVLVTGTFDSGAYTIIRMNDKLASITKTGGQVKVYQATTTGLTATPNWIYEDGVPDATTAITYRKPHHNGRTNRLPMTRIHKTTATTLAAALAEIDASSTPLCYWESNVLYFSIASGGDATTSDIYLDSVGSGLVTQATSFSAASITFQDLDIRYGGLDSRAFRRVHLSNVKIFGSKSNCWDYRGNASFEYLEVACGGSQLTDGTGDGVNGHGSGNLTGTYLYSHDNLDDGESSHEWCRTNILNAYFEYNGGAAVAVAYGCDGVYLNCESYRNQQVSGRKSAAFLAVGNPIDGGVDTIANFYNCRSIEDTKSFGKEGSETIAVCYSCDSKDSTTGYDVSLMKNCTFSGGGTAKTGGTVVDNSTLVS